MTLGRARHDGGMLVIAHRGASAVETENTPSAFRRADEMGADGVETDVRLVPDGRLVVAHDPVDDADAVPSFSEVLDACDSRMLVNVEIKNSVSDGGHDPQCRVVDLVVAELRRRGSDQAHRWLISSFSEATIRAVRMVAPDVPTAWLCRLATASDVSRLASAGHRAVHPWHGTVSGASVAEAHDAALAVNVWTCNDPGRIAELATMGVDAVCTDVPDEALAALGRTGDVNPRWSLRG